MSQTIASRFVISARKGAMTSVMRSMSSGGGGGSSSSMSVPSWATLDPAAMGVESEPHAVLNCVAGKWTSAKHTMSIPHPLNTDAPDIFTIPDTQVDELKPFIESLRSVPKTGLHNPLKNPERYVEYGEISRKVQHSVLLFLKRLHNHVWSMDTHQADVHFL